MAKRLKVKGRNVRYVLVGVKKAKRKRKGRKSSRAKKARRAARIRRAEMRRGNPQIFG